MFGEIVDADAVAVTDRDHVHQGGAAGKIGDFRAHFFCILIPFGEKLVNIIIALSKIPKKAVLCQCVQVDRFLLQQKRMFAGNDNVWFDVGKKMVFQPFDSSKASISRRLRLSK